MVNEEILAGLKTALSKRESLQKAMMSFYNAGYKRNEIEEAARIVQFGEIEEDKKIKKSEQVEEPVEALTPQPKPIKQETRPPKPKEKVIQRVSQYEEGKPKYIKGRIIIIFLIFLLFILIGALIGIFLFKDELINMFSKLI